MQFGYDVHGSVSQLVDPDTGAVEASYGYDAYGNPDDSLRVGDSDPADPLTRWGWAAERVDPLTGTQGMGARRYGPQQGRFLQADSYLGAVPNLGLSTDPLTSNRYAFTAGNPVTYIDPTGHALIANGGGTSYTADEAGTTATDGWMAGLGGLDPQEPGGTSMSDMGSGAATTRQGDVVLADHSGVNWFNPFSPNSDFDAPDVADIRSAINEYNDTLCFRPACVERAQHEVYRELAHWHTWNVDYAAQEGDLDGVIHHTRLQRHYWLESARHEVGTVRDTFSEVMARLILRRWKPGVVVPQQVPEIEFHADSVLPDLLGGRAA